MHQHQKQIWRHSAKGPIHRLAAATRLPLEHAGAADHDHGPAYGYIFKSLTAYDVRHPSPIPHQHHQTHDPNSSAANPGGRPLLFIAAGGEQNEVGVWDLSSASGRCKQCFRAVLPRPPSSSVSLCFVIIFLWFMLLFV